MLGCLELIKKTGDINSENIIGWTILHQACSCNKLKIAELALEYGADINPSKASITPLDLAIESNNILLVDLLFKHGAKIEALSPHNLSVAIRNNNIEMIKLLLVHGAKFDDLPNHHLFVEIKTKIMEPVNLLLADGAKLDTLPDHGLLSAIETNNIERVKLFLENGTKLDDLPDHGLLSAMKTKSIGMVNLLLAHGAKLDDLRAHGLFAAIETNNIEIVKLFLELGAMCDVPPDTDILSCLREVFIKNNYEIARLVFKHFTKFYVLNDSNLSCLRQALRIKFSIEFRTEIDNENKSLMKLLLEKGGAVNPERASDITLLFLAVEMDKNGIINMLLTHGYFNIQSDLGVIIMYLAIRYSNGHIVRLLLEHGANPNFKDDCGRTFLHESQHRCSIYWRPDFDVVSMASLLIDYGADLTIADNDGNYPLTYMDVSTDKQRELLAVFLKEAIKRYDKDRLPALAYKLRHLDKMLPHKIDIDYFFNKKNKYKDILSILSMAGMIIEDDHVNMIKDMFGKDLYEPELFSLLNLTSVVIQNDISSKSKTIQEKHNKIENLPLPELLKQSLAPRNSILKCINLKR